VQITMAEDGGIGTRAGFYDTAGAARDVLQNHVLQLLALTAMLRALSPERAQLLSDSSGLPLRLAIFHSLRRLVALLLVSLACFALGFIPFVGPIVAPVLQFLWTAQAIGWEMLDPYFDKRKLTWDQQKAEIRQHRAEVLGLGVVCAPLLAVPLIGPLFFGVLQAGTAGFVVKLFPESGENATLLSSDL
jgi:uncharacterized protein involved in cysteine biosynthesis